MAWVIAGATVLGAGINAYSSNKASKSQAASAREGMAAEERMFNQSLELQEPYRQAGYESLQGLQNLATPEGRAQSLSDYYAGDEYAALQNQQENQAMRNAQMTGGVRSGSNQQALASIAPQLGQNYLSSQYNNLTGLANMGMGAASQGAQGMSQLGQSMNATQQQIGQARAANTLAQGSNISNAIGTLGGLAYDYYNPTQKVEGKV